MAVTTATHQQTTEQRQQLQDLPQAPPQEDTTRGPEQERLGCGGRLDARTRVEHGARDEGRPPADASVDGLSMLRKKRACTVPGEIVDAT